MRLIVEDVLRIDYTTYLSNTRLTRLSKRYKESSIVFRARRNVNSHEELFLGD
jgi:hypothetical protein